MLAMNFLFGFSGFPRYPLSMLSITSLFLVSVQRVLLSSLEYCFSLSVFLWRRVSLPGLFSFPMVGCDCWRCCDFDFHLAVEVHVGFHGCFGFCSSGWQNSHGEMSGVFSCKSKSSSRGTQKTGDLC